MKPINYLLIVIAAGLISCNHIYYAPNSASLPLLTEKNEMRINGGLASGSASEFSGGDLQFCYAASKNWGIMLNGFTAGKTENTGSYDESGIGSYIEAAGGYFTRIENSKWVADAYGGIGLGSVKNDYGPGNGSSRVGITKLFLQPCIGFKSKYFEIGFTPKISYVNWKVKEDNIVGLGKEDDRQNLAFIHSKPGFLAFEPAIVLRAGFENVKLQLELSGCNAAAPISNIIESETASIGISINFNTRKK